MIEVSTALLVVLIILSAPTILFLVFILVYFIAGIRDLYFVRYHKPNDTEKNCPYEKDKEE